MTTTNIPLSNLYKLSNFGDSFISYAAKAAKSLKLISSKSVGIFTFVHQEVQDLTDD